MPDTTARDFGPDLVVFDADNHLYETEDALTRFLPKEYSGLFRYVELNGRKKVVVRDRLSDFILNPTFEVVAAPGAHMAFFSGDNPEGKPLRELLIEAAPQADRIEAAARSIHAAKVADQAKHLAIVARGIFAGLPGSRGYAGELCRP